MKEYVRKWHHFVDVGGKRIANGDELWYKKDST